MKIKFIFRLTKYRDQEIQSKVITGFLILLGLKKTLKLLHINPASSLYLGLQYLVGLFTICSFMVYYS